MRSVHVYTQAPEKLSALTSDLFQFQFYDREKSLQKVLRTTQLTEMLLHLATASELSAIEKTVDFARQILADKNIWIVVWVDEDLDASVYQSVQGLDVNDVRMISSGKEGEAINALENLVEHLDRFSLRIQEKDNQIQLLSSINRFSQHRKRLKDMIEQCAHSLAQFSMAYTTLIAYQTSISSLDYPDNPIDKAKVSELTQEQEEQLIAQAISVRGPKVELLPKSVSNLPLIASLDKKIGGYLVYPITIYGKTIASILCFIAEEDLSKFGTSKINVMKESSNQLELILERRQAEQKLLSQYQRLKETLSELEATKEQLVHSEKMASVGTMAAGIAHEINNPLAFVLGNFDPLEEYVSSLVHMLDLHDQLVSTIDKTAESEMTKRISQTRKEQDIDFIVDDLRSLVSDSRDGLLRVRDIISDLSSFTRKEQIETKSFDVAHLLEETLRILKIDIPESVTVTTSVGEAVVVQSHRGFVQQVLTNLIKNASHALLDEVDNNQKAIHVDVQDESDNITIKVIDNGPGIPEKTKSKIFDPFFTTKEVGKGTGLGLSVSYNLAKKIGGELVLNTDNTQKTEFQLHIPKGENEKGQS